MIKIHASFETLPVEISSTALSKPFDVRTDIDHHIHALCELVNVLLDQADSVPTTLGKTKDRPFLKLRDEVRRFEIELIQRALTRARGRQVFAAKLLGVKATTLNAKIKRYGLQWPHLLPPASPQLNTPNSES